MAKQTGTLDRPYWSAIVVDGDSVKLRLTAERKAFKTPVHVDWCRFTVIRRNCPLLPVDVLFPPASSKDTVINHFRPEAMERRLPVQDMQTEEFQAAAEAYELAKNVCTAMGEHFRIISEPMKGMDFYKYRWSIHMNDKEVAWVGFLGCSSSPRQSAQDKTIHVNLHGMACTFASPGWRDRIADICAETDATLTRCDLALDFFDGFEGGIQKVWDQYVNGECNVNGRKLKFSSAGDWANGAGRSIYIGSRESGKITNVYEKGDQLFGEKHGSDWIRAELRYGNQDRVLSIEMLRRPADFFAGASDWHKSLIDLADFECESQAAPTNGRLEQETIQGEAVRYTRWLVRSAGPALAAAIKYLSPDDLWDAVQGAALPTRLKKFSGEQLAKHLPIAFKRFASCEALEAFMTYTGAYEKSLTVEGSPAFA